MNKNASESSFVLPSWMRAWERFFFTPADPTLFGLLRLLAGSIILYTVFAYSYHLPQFMGPNAWTDLALRIKMTRERPVTPPNLSKLVELPEPADPADREYLKLYKEKFGFDLRGNGLTMPKTDQQRDYLVTFTLKYRMPPSGYLHGSLEEQEIEAAKINEYIQLYGVDPRGVYAAGAPYWSLWFHVTDPSAMLYVHYVIVFVVFLFTIGFATRVTSVLTWFGFMTYIHRNTQVLFGADTMYVIMLTYFMIGPSGAALSVDRLILRWWSQAKPGIVRRWYRLLGRAEPSDAEITPVRYSEHPEPLVSANLAIRLLQIHLCYIYLIAGVAKLLGQSWWSGTAVWGTFANSEFAPLQNPLYLNSLRFMCEYPILLNIMLNGGGLFTLVFEIGYAFLIWRPNLRWVFLAAAIVLHGLIGMIMGLKTFALIMLVMNMAFLTPTEVAWILRGFRMKRRPTTDLAEIAPEPTPTVSKTAVKARG